MPLTKITIFVLSLIIFSPTRPLAAKISVREIISSAQENGFDDVKTKLVVYEGFQQALYLVPAKQSTATVATPDITGVHYLKPAPEFRTEWYTPDYEPASARLFEGSDNLEQLARRNAITQLSINETTSTIMISDNLPILKSQDWALNQKLPGCPCDLSTTDTIKLLERYGLKDRPEWITNRITGAKIEIDTPNPTVRDVLYACLRKAQQSGLGNKYYIQPVSSKRLDRLAVDNPETISNITGWYILAM